MRPRALTSATWTLRDRLNPHLAESALRSAVFAIEALGLVDHFGFLDRSATGKQRSAPKRRRPSASKRDAAVESGWFLSTSDRWVDPYFDPDDLHCADRTLFADRT